MTINIDGAATNTDLKINIIEIRLKTIIWPAVILANNRIIRAKGLVINPINSTGNQFNRNHNWSQPYRNAGSIEHMLPVPLVTAELCN